MEACDPEKPPYQILMVDDDPPFCRFIGQMLTRQAGARFEVSRAGSLEEARNQMSGQRPDAVLLDLNLPDCTGVETVLRLKALSDGVPIVVLTGSDDEQIGQEVLRAGAGDFLVKDKIGNDPLVRCLLYVIQQVRCQEVKGALAKFKDVALEAARRMKANLEEADVYLNKLLSCSRGEVSANAAETIANLKENNAKQIVLLEQLINIKL